MFKVQSIILIAAMFGNASATGCYPTYTDGGPYSAGDVVSATTVTETPTTTACTVGTVGCPASGYLTTSIMVGETHNYECASGENSVYCSNSAYAPNEIYSSTTWIKESTECMPNSQGAIVPVIERRATSSTTGSCNLERSQTLYVGCGYSYVSEADRDRQCKSKRNGGTSKIIFDSWEEGKSCNLKRSQTLYVGCGYSYVVKADRDRQCKSNGGTSRIIFDSWDGGSTSKNCPDFSDMKGSTDNTCECETGIKTNKITYQDGENGEVHACALEDYSVTECYDSLDCDFDNSMCTCVRADIYPIFVCNQMQCIPRDGSAKGQACYTSQNCASNSCVYWTGDSNDATCN